MSAQLVAAAVKIVAVSCQHWQQFWPHNQLTTLPKRIANRKVVHYFWEYGLKKQNIIKLLWTFMGKEMDSLSNSALLRAFQHSAYTYCLSLRSHLAPPRVSFAACGCCPLSFVYVALYATLRALACVVLVKIEKASRVSNVASAVKYAKKLSKLKKKEYAAIKNYF